ncbi:DsbA family oxidoreductase [Vibrio alginolyticus]|uniref:DsbA family oxidoreductase n=1 Tax=Vibrio alginolyticus TaxID=663 RepID=UPI00215F1284|nr:DsbA family protein [Vibrio alginolyticus]MCS0172333.1 DsbA family protein [Vibrio alginolyticus]
MKVEFFHDVVCGWCYIQSPILRELNLKYNVEVVHRNFILQKNDQEMIARWGSLEAAKEQVLQHWESCMAFEGKPERFNINGMRESSFNYPNGMLAAKATKTAEILGGQTAHWDMFDTLQKFHLQDSKNVSDINVIKEAINIQSYDEKIFIELMNSEQVNNELSKDALMAFNYGVKSIPTLVVNNEHVIRSTTKLPVLMKMLSDLEVL